jgi:peptidyl-tRNA hydrolase
MSGRSYIFMRSDLHSLNPGKAMAQAAHAGTAFTSNFYEGVYEDILPKEVFDEWTNEGVDFGTTIVLDADENTVNSIFEGLEKEGIRIPVGKIVDPTYPFKAQKELIPFLDKDFVMKKDFIIVDHKADSYGMISCTRNEYTCGYLFVWKDEDIEAFEKITNFYGIKLYR